MRKNGKTGFLLIFVLTAALFLAACSLPPPAAGTEGDADLNQDRAAEDGIPGSEGFVQSAVDFDHELDKYEPLKDHYNFYFTYKTVHPW